MKNRRAFPLVALGCTLLVLIVIICAGAVAILLPFRSALAPAEESSRVVAVTEVIQREENVAEVRATQVAIPTLSASEQVVAQAEATAEQVELAEPASIPDFQDDTPYLNQLYEELNPGVVSIRIFVQDATFGAGEGAGSGFILDDNGYIVTNNHVVAGASQVIVVFYNGFEALAEVVGTDDDSDLAVIQVEQLPEGAHPLPVGDSDDILVGERVVALGNPFGLRSSMSLGIVSAVGRTIPSGVTRFSIPQAIQTDAAINPGNSGGPLLNLQGQVIGVNAQIRTENSIRANSGVGFAIPSNVVRLVAPVLIEQGYYQWPWLGIEGGDVDLAVQLANDLETQNGAYIGRVLPGGPADQAGMQGFSGLEDALGRTIQVGGDVVVAFDGNPVESFADLLTDIAFSQPGQEVVLTVLRNGQRLELPVVLAARPQEFD